MANYCVINGNLYENSTAKSLSVNGGSLLRVQANIPNGGRVSYTVKGKITSNGTEQNLMGINDTALETVTTISDNGIYSFDVSGYHSVSVTVTKTGDVKIYGTIFAE